MGSRRNRIPVNGDGPDSSVGELVVPATDLQGHSVRCQFRCSPQLDRQVEELVSSKRFPFKTHGDFYRWAVQFGCFTLLQFADNVPNFISSLESANSMLNRMQWGIDLRQHVETASKIVGELQKAKAWGEIVKVVGQLRRHAEGVMEAEPYWGEEWLKQVNSTFADVERFAEANLPDEPLVRPVPVRGSK